MGYLDSDELKSLGIKCLGQNVKVSRKASIYNPEMLSIGDNSRIDDFCVISGKVEIGRNVHITPMCLVAGGSPGITLCDFATLAYGCKVFSQSDDYSGETLVNSTIPRKYKNETFSPVIIARQAVIGASSTILPGVEIGEGCSVGAGAVVTKSTSAWKIYAGVPAKEISTKSKNCVYLLNEYLKEEADNESSF